MIMRAITYGGFGDTDFYVCPKLQEKASTNIFFIIIGLKFKTRKW